MNRLIPKAFAATRESWRDAFSGIDPLRDPDGYRIELIGE